MANMSRGMIFTIAMMLLCVSLLALVIPLANQTSSGKMLAAHLLSFDRTTDAYADMNDEIVRILAISGNYSVSNRSVLIVENLPWSEQVGVDLLHLSEFESNFSDADFSVSMNLTYCSAGTFVIRPNNATISHGTDSFYITPQGAEALFAPEYYELNLTFPEGSINFTDWTTLALSGNSSGLAVRVRVQDLTQSKNYYFDERLDRGQESKISVYEPGGAEIGYVRFYPPASLEIWHSPEIGLKASVGFPNEVYVEANDLITIVSTVNRTAKVRIA